MSAAHTHTQLTSWSCLKDRLLATSTTPFMEKCLDVSHCIECSRIPKRNYTLICWTINSSLSVLKTESTKLWQKCTMWIKINTRIASVRSTQMSKQAWSKFGVTRFKCVPVHTNWANLLSYVFRIVLILREMFSVAHEKSRECLTWQHFDKNCNFYAVMQVHHIISIVFCCILTVDKSNEFWWIAKVKLYMVYTTV